MGSLKDKAVIFDFSVLFSQIQQGKTLHKTEQYIKLSDAEEEIEKWKNTDYTDLEIDLANKDKEIEILKLNLDKHKKKVVLLEDELYSTHESGKVASREIETLVELLRGIKNDYGMILSFNYRDKITQTLKKYE